MTLRYNRSIAAAVLVLAGVIGPCIAWFVVGSGAARQRAEGLETAAIENAHREVARIAEQIGLRLEALRQAESRRPFEEYLSESQRYLADCACEVAARSPLSQGPVDPLIWAHFQIDGLGLLTLPTLGIRDVARTDTVPREPDPAESLQVSILNELECASTDHLDALHHGGVDGEDPRRLVASRGGIVQVGPFTWHTISITNSPALVALREVSTPAAVLTQGFVVLSNSLEPLAAGSSYPLALRPGSPSPETPVEAVITTQGDPWTLSADTRHDLGLAGEQGHRIRRRFLITFGAGFTAALLAGCAMILLVWRTERLAQERARFAAVAAHELRTPLAGLQLYGEMLAERAGDPGRAPDYARRIADEARRLGRVVTNILTLARFERDEPGLRVVSGDLGNAVRESVERSRPAVEANGARVELAIEAPLPAARFDPDAVDQIIQNLLDNAEKYSRQAEDRTIRIAVRPDGSGLELAVTDCGPGIPAAMRRKLFEPFKRSTGENAPAGLGLGLALVRSSAKAMGAEVGVDQPAEGGTRFTVRFVRG